MRSKLARVLFGAGILIGLWSICVFFPPKKLGTYRVGSDTITARKYGGSVRMVDIRWPRHPVLGWVLQGWLVPGLQKTVIEYPYADSLAVQVLNDSIIVLQPFYLERDQLARKYGKGRVTPVRVDTVILRWDEPAIQNVYQ